MNYGLELLSELIPLLLIVILVIDMKERENKRKKELLLPLISLSIIEIPALMVTVSCMTLGIPHSSFRHLITVAIFALLALTYIIYDKRKRNR